MLLAITQLIIIKDKTKPSYFAFSKLFMTVPKKDHFK